MTKTSKNGLDLIKISLSKVKGKWAKGILASIIYVAPIIAVCAIPYVGLCLAAALFGYLTLGYLNYMQKLIKDENPTLKVLFAQPEFAQGIIIGIVLSVGTLLGLLFFIIPGILMIAYYSFSLFVLNEEEIVNVSDTLTVCSRKMNGHKMGMFAYKVIYYLLYALVGIVTVISLLLIERLYHTMAALAIVLGIIVVLIAIVLIAIVTFCMYAANVVYYDEIVRTQEIENDKIVVNKTEEVVEEVKAEPVEEQAVSTTEEKTVEVVEEKPAEQKHKAAPKKASAAKTTTKTSAAKKPAAKTTATKTGTKTTTKTTAKPAAKKTTTKKD